MGMPRLVLDKSPIIFIISLFFSMHLWAIEKKDICKGSLIKPVQQGRSIVRVLIVDDDPDIVFAIEYALTKFIENKYESVKIEDVLEIHSAGNGREAWVQIQTSRFDVLITDFNMPLMNGLELVQKTIERSQEHNYRIKIILNSASNNLYKLAIPTGVRVLKKPFSLVELDGAFAEAI